MGIDAVTTLTAIVIAFAAAAIAVRVLHVIVNRLVNALEIVGAENRAAVQARARHLRGAFAVLAYAIAAVTALGLALGRLGIAEPQWQPRQVARWLLTHGINILIITAGAIVVVRAANLAIEHLQHKLGRDRAKADLEWQRRAKTLGTILTRLVTVAVAFIAVLMLLRELSIDVLPIVTGAGIAGLAIGFGAQNLVRDVISGFFLILEDQVRIGDLARINGVSGTVEQINLRTIVLRDGEGAVQVFPNGTITSLANLSKQFAYALVDVRVSYGENLDRVVGTLHEVGAALERDGTWGSRVIGSLEVIGVQSLGESTATIQVRLKTRPLDQGKVANELRRRIMTMFVGRGIRPYAG